jgi:alpha-ketoglutaric semialdehyde dehydrogenase
MGDVDHTIPGHELASWVGARWQPGRHAVADVNPAHPRDTVAVAHQSDAELAREAVEAAHLAFGVWRRAPAPERGERLRALSRSLQRRTDLIGHDLSREEGKPVREAIQEVQLAARIFDYFSAQTLDADGETYPSHLADTLVFARREALGVVSVITPWNFPIAIAAWKIAPALAFGNTVVWKPAELVPLTATHVVYAAIESGLPDGVLNVVLGSGSAVGDALVTAPDVAAISFTGSTTVGRAVHQRAVGAGKRALVEMGGKNPALVLADADLELAADKVAQGAFLGSGQKCTATSRVIVEDAVFDDFVERLTARAEAFRVGDPLDPSTDLGPLASAGQLESVLGHIDTARREGATVLTGGRRPGGELTDGYYVEPTVLADVDQSSAAIGEEIFGPVAVVQPATSFDHALDLANDTRFGLSATVFTNDLTKAMRFKDEIRSGIVRINGSTTSTELHVPFGGVKNSGAGGRELGKVAREFFTEWKSVYIGIP